MLFLDHNQEKIYLQLEREHFEKELMNEINDFETTVKQHLKQIQNNRRPGNHIREYVSEGNYLFRGVSGNREAESFIVTKSGTKRLLRSI